MKIKIHKQEENPYLKIKEQIHVQKTSDLWVKHMVITCWWHSCYWQSLLYWHTLLQWKLSDRLVILHLYHCIGINTNFHKCPRIMQSVSNRATDWCQIHCECQYSVDYIQITQETEQCCILRMTAGHIGFTPPITLSDKNVSRLILVVFM